MVRLCFEGLDIECTIVHDERVGLQSLVENNFDVILLDLALPEFSGFDILKSLEEKDLLDSRNILIFTASFLAREDYGKGVLKKPLSIDDLIQAVKIFRKN
jgi:DNA-binding response OmpR family regulator